MAIIISKLNFSKKTFVEALSTIYGLNFQKSIFVARICGLAPFVKVAKVPDRILRRVELFISENFTTGRELNQEIQANLKTLLNIGSYRALRMTQGLPAHGQRTRSNSSTAKKFGRVKNAYFRDSARARLAIRPTNLNSQNLSQKKAGPGQFGRKK